jgi:hypothetical protein
MVFEHVPEPAAPQRFAVAVHSLTSVQVAPLPE